ncbi:Hypothetical protein D9617_20g028500 [Elsinoe fawcettii]|nr:Hypothetical protein D9617_20g028500 [Elsinoe fawcettii]
MPLLHHIPHHLRYGANLRQNKGILKGYCTDIALPDTGTRYDLRCRLWQYSIQLYRENAELPTDYLHPDFEPRSRQIGHLEFIFVLHGIGFSGDSCKDDLLGLFNRNKSKIGGRGRDPLRSAVRSSGARRPYFINDFALPGHNTLAPVSHQPSPQSLRHPSAVPPTFASRNHSRHVRPPSRQEMLETQAMYLAADSYDSDQRLPERLVATMSPPLEPNTPVATTTRSPPTPITRESLHRQDNSTQIVPAHAHGPPAEPPSSTVVVGEVRVGPPATIDPARESYYQQVNEGTADVANSTTGEMLANYRAKIEQAAPSTPHLQDMNHSVASHRMIGFNPLAQTPYVLPAESAIHHTPQSPRRASRRHPTRNVFGVPDEDDSDDNDDEQEHASSEGGTAAALGVVSHRLQGLQEMLDALRSPAISPGSVVPTPARRLSRPRQEDNSHVRPPSHRRPAQITRRRRQDTSGYTMGPTASPAFTNPFARDSGPQIDEIAAPSRGGRLLARNTRPSTASGTAPQGSTSRRPQLVQFDEESGDSDTYTSSISNQSPSEQTSATLSVGSSAAYPDLQDDSNEPERPMPNEPTPAVIALTDHTLSETTIAQPVDESWKGYSLNTLFLTAAIGFGMVLICISVWNDYSMRKPYDVIDEKYRR